MSVRVSGLVFAAAMVPAAPWGHDGTLKPRAYNPARARRLLAEADYPEGSETDLWAIPVARAYMPSAPGCRG